MNNKAIFVFNATPKTNQTRRIHVISGLLHNLYQRSQIRLQPSNLKTCAHLMASVAITRISRAIVSTITGIIIGAIIIEIIISAVIVRAIVMRAAIVIPHAVR